MPSLDIDGEDTSCFLPPSSFLLPTPHPILHMLQWGRAQTQKTELLSLIRKEEFEVPRNEEMLCPQKDVFRY